MQQSTFGGGFISPMVQQHLARSTHAKQTSASKQVKSANDSGKHASFGAGAIAPELQRYESAKSTMGGGMCPKKVEEHLSGSTFGAGMTPKKLAEHLRMHDHQR